LADGLLELDAGFNPENIFVLWIGYSKWQELGYPVHATQITTTTSNPSMTTSATPTTIPTNTLTKTATKISTIPTTADEEQIRIALIDLFVPEFVPVGNPIPILITLTNPIDIQWTTDIPITFTNTKDENDVIVWTINVTLNVEETREILVVGMTMGMAEALWKVKVGAKSRDVLSA